MNGKKFISSNDTVSKEIISVFIPNLRRKLLALIILFNVYIDTNAKFHHENSCKSMQNEEKKFPIWLEYWNTYQYATKGDVKRMKLRNGWNGIKMRLTFRNDSHTQTCHSVRWRMNGSMRAVDVDKIVVASFGADVVAFFPLNFVGL